MLRAGLKVQFIAMAVALVGITVIGSSYFFTRQEKEVLVREMIRRGTTIARNLATISTDPMISSDHLALATFVGSIMKNDGVAYAMILDEKGKVLAHNQIDNVGKAYVEPAGVRPLTNEEILIQSFRAENGETVTDIALPINLRNNARIGSVHVGLSQKSINQLVLQALRESLSIAAGLLIVGVIVAVFVTSFMLRPVEQLVEGVRTFGEGNLNHRLRIKGPRELALLARAFNEMADHLKGLYVGMLRAMAKALASRDAFAGGHDQRSAEWAAACARHIGLDSDAVETIRLAGQVQNLGHIAVPDSILQNTGKLKPEEYETLKEHPLVGADILNQIPAFREAVPLVRHHHERFDGRGYPGGLAGKDIPLGARILAVADAFDAMTSAQKHRPAIPRVQAIAELRKSAGTQFDPEIVDAFIESLPASERVTPS